jgi:hypothetical protein
MPNPRSNRKKATTQSGLAMALQSKQVARFTRPFEPGFVEGYILAIGPEFFLLALLVDGVRFNGFQCFRISDVRGLRVPTKNHAFIEAALKLKKQRIPKMPRIKLTSLKELLSSANRAFPLVTIHREKFDPDICHIGRVVAVGGSQVSLLEIGPDAMWDKELCHYKLKEITRVDFGGDYEDALHLVGGRPPADQPA